jgi:hypothetical protein
MTNILTMMTCRGNCVVPRQNGLRVRPHFILFQQEEDGSDDEYSDNNDVSWKLRQYFIIYFSKRRTDQMTNILTMCRGKCVIILLYFSKRRTDQMTNILTMTDVSWKVRHYYITGIFQQEED